MRTLSSIVFNPALLTFLVIIGVTNLAVNLIYQFGFVDEKYLARASEVSAIAFIVAVIYTAIFERESAGR
jgi:hypothetical protein